MKKKSCLIVGGGIGLGLALAKVFASRHFDVAVISKRQQVLDVIGEAVVTFGRQFMPIVCDIRDFTALAEGIDRFESEFGTPTVLIYNAAGYSEGNALQQDPHMFMDDLTVSVGAFIVSYQKVFSGMARAGGSILVTGGGIAYKPSFESLSLGVGKTAIDYVVNSIAPEFSKRGIHVAIVTIRGAIKEGTHFSPDKIAEAYWDLHHEPVGSFTLNRDYT